MKEEKSLCKSDIYVWLLEVGSVLAKKFLLLDNLGKHVLMLVLLYPVYMYRQIYYVCVYTYCERVITRHCTGLVECSVCLDTVIPL